MVKNQQDASENGTFCNSIHSADCHNCHQKVEAIDLSHCFYCVGVLCWACWDKHHGACEMCFQQEQRERRKEEARKADPFYARVMGRPKVMRSCPFCGEMFSAIEMRVHKPKCRAFRSGKVVEQPWSDR